MTERLAALSLTPADRQSLGEHWETVAGRADRFVRRLYAKFRETPQLAEMLQQESRIERLIALQHQYIIQLFQQTIGREYVLQRLRIGLIHHRIRVTPQWYLATYAHFFCEYVDAFYESGLPEGTILDLLDSLHKSIFFDASLVLDAYGHVADSESAEKRLSTTTAETSINNLKHSVTHEPTLSINTGYGITRLRVSESDTTSRRDFIGIDAETQSHLNTIRPQIESALPTILNEFYQYVRSRPELADIVPENQIDRLISQVSAYWKEFLLGEHDSRYAASRMRIGVIHESIGLKLQWYLVGLGRQVSGILKHLRANSGSLQQPLKALFRRIYFDMTFVVDAYMEARAATLLQIHGYAEQLMSGLTSAVVIVNQHERVLYANESFLELTGIEPSLLYMMELSGVLPSNDILTTLRSKRSAGAQRAECMQSWSEQLFRVTMVRLQESTTGEHSSTAIVFDDVGDIVQLSEDIELDSQQYKRLTNAVSGVLWEMDWETQTLLSISHPTIDLLGYRDIYFLGRSGGWQQCILSCDRKRFEVNCAALSTGNQGVCEYRMVRADGREIWVRSHLTRTSRNSQLIIAAVTTDITRERHSELLRLVALEDVAAGMMNIINNSLTVISANLELEMDSSAAASGKRPVHSPFLIEAQRAAQRAAKILGQVKHFARGQFLRSRTIRVNDALNAAFQALQLQCGPLVHLEMNLATNLWDVCLDPDHLIAAISHLCENAGRAMPSGGTVRLATSNVEAHQLIADETGFLGDWVEISVEDHGVGITAEVLERAIEPFFTTASSSDRYGLGLSMVHGFVSQSGGHLRIQSIPGAGTTVRLRVPRFAPQTSVTVAAVRNDPQTSTLVVDSDESVRSSARLLLERLGHRVLTAPDADSALKVITEHGVRLLITDLPLRNGLDGMSLARRMTELIPDLQVIIMTGSGLLEQVHQSLPVSWVVLEKPFSSSDLAQSLSEALKDRTTRSTQRSLLTTREKEVLQWIAAGKSQAETAILLNISERTVEQHVRNSKLKLNAVNTIQAVVDAIALGEIEPPHSGG